MILTVICVLDVYVFKNWKLLFENICENIYRWKNVLKYVKCCLKTKNNCLKTQTKHPLLAQQYYWYTWQSFFQTQHYRIESHVMQSPNCQCCSLAVTFMKILEFKFPNSNYWFILIKKKKKKTIDLSRNKLKNCWPHFSAQTCAHFLPFILFKLEMNVCLVPMNDFKPRDLMKI